MASFYYPIKVIKKKMLLPNYKPVAIDCVTGDSIKLASTKKESAVNFIVQVTLLLVAITTMYFVVIDPVVRTVASNFKVEDNINSLGRVDTATIAKLRARGTLVSETTDNNAVNLTLRIDKAAMQECLDLALSLSTVKEVSTDGDNISIIFLSSAK